MSDLGATNFLLLLILCQLIWANLDRVFRG